MMAAPKNPNTERAREILAAKRAAEKREREIIAAKVLLKGEGYLVWPRDQVVADLKGTFREGYPAAYLQGYLGIDESEILGAS